jgi:nucleotide-binding universal stress UspA family protein
LSIVHVWSYPYGEATVQSEARELTRVDAALHLEEIVGKARARSGADIEGLLIEGEARSDVAAQAFSADLVVLGTHHRRAVGLVPIGSVTDAVIAHATCPIVMVSERTVD